MTKEPPVPRVVEISGRQAGEPRVLIVRLSAVGDCVQTMPLACAVRQRWPEARVTWVVEKGAAPLVEVNEAVDRMVVLPKRFATSMRMLRWLRDALRHERFDVSLDPQGLTKSGLAAWLSGAQRRIGFARPAAREINPWLQTEWVASRAVHRVDRYLELLRPLGITQPEVRFGLSLPPAAEAVAEEVASRAELRGGYVALNPGAGWDSKRWPVDRFAEVARHLAARGMPCVVTWGGEQERAWSEAIVSQSAGAATMAPATSLVELAAVLRRARLFVGSDTGPLHLAAAVGTPCVAMFGASAAEACGPYGDGHIRMQVALDESPGRKLRGAGNWAMRMIGTAAVCEACDRLLSRSERTAAAGSRAA